MAVAESSEDEAEGPQRILRDEVMREQTSSESEHAAADDRDVDEQERDSNHEDDQAGDQVPLVRHPPPRRARRRRRVPTMELVRQSHLAYARFMRRKVPKLLAALGVSNSSDSSTD